MSELLDLADEEEIVIGWIRGNGTKGSTPIWGVKVGDELYVRSAGGLSGWYRHFKSSSDGEIREGRKIFSVRVELVNDPQLVVKVTDAYIAKYSGSSFLEMLITGQACGATLHVTRR